MTLKILDNKQEETTKTEIIKLSASSIKTYDQCPRKWKFTYLDKAPKKDHDYFELGNLCHKTLELFHANYMKDTKQSFGTLSKLMSACFLDAKKEVPNVKIEIKNEAKILLLDYLKSVINSGMPNVQATELPFNFQIGDDILIRGFIDRLDLTEDGTFHIIDYKTTKNPRYLEPMQLLIYGLALQRNYPEIEKFRASYILLKHNGKLKDYNFTKEDLVQVEKEIMHYGQTIRNENEWLPMPSRLCDWCDFKELCEAHKGW